MLSVRSESNLHAQATGPLGGQVDRAKVVWVTGAERASSALCSLKMPEGQGSEGREIRVYWEAARNGVRFCEADLQTSDITFPLDPLPIIGVYPTCVLAYVTAKVV